VDDAVAASLLTRSAYTTAHPPCLPLLALDFLSVQHPCSAVRDRPCRWASAWAAGSSIAISMLPTLLAADQRRPKRVPERSPDAGPGPSSPFCLVPWPFWDLRLELRLLGDHFTWTSLGCRPMGQASPGHRRCCCWLRHSGAAHALFLVIPNSLAAGRLPASPFTCLHQTPAGTIT